MDYTKAERWNTKEVFYLNFRKELEQKYNVVYGVKNIVDEILRSKITQNELDFAIDFYKHQDEIWWNGKFNSDRWQRIIDDNNWMIPLKVLWVEDWTVLRAWEPILRVEWEAEIAAVFEPLFIRLFYQSLVATTSMIIEEIIWEWRMIEFWYRSAINDSMHISACEALASTWITKTSSDVSACVLDLKTEWTTAHRFFTAYPSEDEAMEDAIIKNNKVALLVDSVEAYAWIDKIIKLKKKYRESWKIIAPRLDSWDLADQCVYTLNELKKAWMIDPKMDKIIVEDFDWVEDILRIELAVSEAWFNPEDYIMYGSWSLLMAKDKTRDIVWSVYKLSQTEDWPTMKLSKNKNSIPWSPNLEIREDKRVIVQEDEEVKWERLLKPLYDNWEFFYEIPWLKDIELANQNIKRTMNFVNYEQKISEVTLDIINKFKEKVGYIS
jgi:nicotinic acid phosphoribosyltransferase